MADPTAKKKRLPRLLQEYKKEVKQLTFEQKVREYFSLSPYQRKIDSHKKEIVYKSFSRIEKEVFSTKYEPIYSAIDRYSDRLRAIYNNTILYTNYVTAELRKKDILSYTADFLNNTIASTERAMEEANEEKVKKALKKTIKTLKGYHVPDITNMMKQDKEGTFEIKNDEIDKELLWVVERIKGFLAMLKCYIESLKEFLEWVGTPELFPQEFSEMERSLMVRYTPIPIPTTNQNPDKDKFPLFFHTGEAAKEFGSIDYNTLPRSMDIFGENNLFVLKYRSFFNY